MTIKELVKHIAKYEGKKHEASVSDIREIVGILSDIFYSDVTVKGHSKTEDALFLNGKRRAKKKGKK